MSTITLYNDDCMNIMKTMADKSIDLVLCDPPYGIGFVYEQKEECNKPENYYRFLLPFFNEMKRVSKKYVAMAQATKYMRYFWDWYGEDIRIYIGCKNFVSLRKTFMNYAYDPWVFYFHQGIDYRTKEKPARNLDWVKCDTAGLRNPRNIERGHPTPKPKSMMIEIVRNFTDIGDTILDPFMGSGTTGIAAKEIGCSFIGIEKDSGYFEIAKQRIEG